MTWQALRQSTLLVAFAGMTLVVISGCASYSIKNSKSEIGYRVYRPDPYLLVTETDQSVSAQIVWLPNFAEYYTITTSNALAKADFEFHFENGWMLKSIADKSDNTALAKDLLPLIDKRVPMPREKADETTRYLLYRLEFDADTGQYVSLHRVDTGKSANN